ncbi:MAG: PH domain-containing protein [Phycisphaerae bacterium]|nr:PH domain-containing protein [Phycisphaerae bacterium]
MNDDVIKHERPAPAAAAICAAPEPIVAAASDAVVVVPPRVPALQGEVLSGDELIQVSLKPSPWYIWFVSWRWVVSMALAAALIFVAKPAASVGYDAFLINCCIVVALGRVMYAVQQWASRHYYLTNRRVVRVTGVLRTDFRDCLLTRVSVCQVRAAAYQRWLNLGSVQIRSADARSHAVNWNFVANPHKVHELLVRAIRRAQCDE